LSKICHHSNCAKNCLTGHLVFFDPAKGGDQSISKAAPGCDVFQGFPVAYNPVCRKIPVGITDGNSDDDPLGIRYSGDFFNRSGYITPWFSIQVPRPNSKAARQMGSYDIF